MVHFHPFGHILVQNNNVIPYPRTWVELDLAAFGSNLRLLRDHLGSGVEIALVCKADAYGHGLVPMGRFAVQSGVSCLAVATVQEGIALREAGIESRVMVMSPILPIELDQAVFYGLDIFVESREMIEACNQASLKLKKVAHLHLKVDTGLHRFGCAPGDVSTLFNNAKELDGVRIVGLAHHFIDSAYDLDSTETQRSLFNHVVKSLEDMGMSPSIIHQSNSAGAWRYGRESGNLVRVGIMAYGVDPSGMTKGKLVPVMRWFARLTSLRTVPAGGTVSYSSTYTLEKESIIATLGIGYGDGYPRSLSNKGWVMVRGVRCPVVGLVCMDQTLIDVTDVPEVEIGDVAEMLGENISVAELARLSSTNSHEILTRVMSRVSRRYVNTGFQSR